MDIIEVGDCTYTLYNDDCLKCMPELEDNSVDLIAVDLPYGTTQNKWDVIIPFVPMWEQFKRIIKPNGRIVLTATEPFTSKLILSNLEMFKYDIIWEKSVGSGQLNINIMPLRVHEHILVFYNKSGTYNEQKTIGRPYEISRKVNYTDGCYGDQKNNSKNNTGFRHAKSVVKLSNPRIKGGHPTQKPVKLMEYIIKTYSNKGDMVLDCCMGHGSTGSASLNLQRNFIGIEIDKDYYLQTKNSLKEQELFTC